MRPKWEDVSPYDRTVKTLWAYWDQLEIHDQVLSEMGRGKWFQNQVPDHPPKETARDGTKSSP